MLFDKLSDDIIEYIQKYIDINEYNKIALVSKNIYNLFSIKNLLKFNSLFNICNNNKNNDNVILVKYISYSITKKYNYKKNINIISNIVKHTHLYPIFNLKNNNKLFIIYDIIELLYHCLNKKYTNILIKIKKIKIKYNKLLLNDTEYVTILSFLIYYITPPLEYDMINSNYYYHYSYNTTVLYKIVLSCILFILVKCDNNSINQNFIIKKKYIFINQNKKIKEFINSVEYNKYLYPKYFKDYILLLYNELYISKYI
jgi:hypothetical protein